MAHVSVDPFKMKICPKKLVDRPQAGLCVIGPIKVARQA